MTQQKTDAPPSARHRTDLVSLIFGLIFVAVAAWWAASYYLDWVIRWSLLPDVGWLLAAGLIVLGLVGIVASLRRDRRAAEPVTAPPATTAVSAASTTEPVAAPESAPPVRRDDLGSDLDRPAASDPGGHRPE